MNVIRTKIMVQKKMEVCLRHMDVTSMTVAKKYEIQSFEKSLLSALIAIFRITESPCSTSIPEARSVDARYDVPPNSIKMHGNTMKKQLLGHNNSLPDSALSDCSIVATSSKPFTIIMECKCSGPISIIAAMRRHDVLVASNKSKLASPVTTGYCVVHWICAI